MEAARRSHALTPDTPVRFLKGVGEGREALLANAGLATVGELLMFFPYRYEDRRHPVHIKDLRRIDSPVSLRGRLLSASLKVSPVKRLRIFEAILDDGTGTVMLVWFNQPYLKDQLKRGDQLAIYGQPRVSSYGKLQIENPDFEKVDPAGESDDEGAIVPVYSAVSGIPPKAVRKIVQHSLEAAAAVVDPLPDTLRSRLKVIPLIEAILSLHHPQSLEAGFDTFRTPAHKRIILQEFFAFQLALRVRRAAEEQREKSRKTIIDDRIRDLARKALPFTLTRAQKRVLKEIADDLQSDRPMYRLLQGDVGSGKTIIALISAIIAIGNGHQAALLAPTEILAEQHLQRIRQLVEHAGIRVAKLTGSTPAAEARAILGELQRGALDLIVGTHALLEDRVRFRSFALAIVDEQHRFGVAQRKRFFAKGDLPDILVMTATPIPRSLALAVYGDLELSVIDELPPGRQPIKTIVRGSARLPKVYEFIEQQLAAGAQAYIVFPIIEESEKLDLKPLTIGFESLRRVFPDRRLAMLHGRMSADEKQSTMAAFKKGEIDILVATTVIEVGIDVPNVSIMLIMDADRFGLSQLHQLRGRVGRGSRKSYCIPIRDETTSEEAKERLKMFEQTRDGFDVAERDLQLRGAGDFLGTRQSGMPRFRFGNILRDHELMELARDVAIETLAKEGLASADRLARALTSESSSEKD